MRTQLYLFHMVGHPPPPLPGWHRWLGFSHCGAQVWPTTSPPLILALYRPFRLHTAWVCLSTEDGPVDNKAPNAALLPIVGERGGKARYLRGTPSSCGGMMTTFTVTDVRSQSTI